ncbi:hypothetical protein E2562_024831, partial [Oryza meyeriana var. granulata]
LGKVFNSLQLFNCDFQFSKAARLDHSCHGVVCIMMEFRKIGGTRVFHQAMLCEKERVGKYIVERRKY